MNYHSQGFLRFSNKGKRATFGDFAKVLIWPLRSKRNATRQFSRNVPNGHSSYLSTISLNSRYFEAKNNILVDMVHPFLSITWNLLRANLN